MVWLYVLLGAAEWAAFGAFAVAIGWIVTAMVASVAEALRGTRPRFEPIAWANRAGEDIGWAFAALAGVHREAAPGRRCGYCRLAYCENGRCRDRDTAACWETARLRDRPEPWRHLCCGGLTERGHTTDCSLHGLHQAIRDRDHG